METAHASQLAALQSEADAKLEVVRAQASMADANAQVDVASRELQQ